MVDDNRAIFMYKDGSQAWDAKDFLIQQEDCVDVTIENQVYKGPATPFVCIFQIILYIIIYNIRILYYMFTVFKKIKNFILFISS